MEKFCIVVALVLFVLSIVFMAMVLIRAHRQCNDRIVSLRKQREENCRLANSL